MIFNKIILLDIMEKYIILVKINMFFTANQRFQQEEPSYSFRHSYSDLSGYDGSNGEVQVVQREGYVTCQICYEEYQEGRVSTFGSCGHIFCHECMKEHITSICNRLAFPQCPSYECGERLDIDGPLYHSLSYALQNKIQKVVSYHKNISNPNYKPCQIANCNGSLDLPTLCCSQCQAKHCKNCFGIAHEGECEVKVAIQLEMTKKYRQCSKCGQVIQKTQGCTHMTCTCGHYFCYSCGQAIRGNHECQTPSHLNCMQKLKWQIQHLQFWYETSNCALLKILLLFSPPSSFSPCPRTIWIICFTVTFYPLILAIAITLALAAAAILLGLALFLSLLLPFIALCGGNGLELFPNYHLVEHCGCCVGFLVVLLLYPLIYLLNLIQILVQIISEEGLRIFLPFTELLQGVKLIFLFPCLMAVDNSKYYMETAKLRQNDPNAIQSYDDGYIE